MWLISKSSCTPSFELWYGVEKSEQKEANRNRLQHRPSTLLLLYVYYTVRFQDAIYVLPAFQKKSKKGVATPQKDIDLIYRRLAEAERLHRERQK